MKETTITVTIRIRGVGSDDYGVVRVEIPASSIDWSLADGPKDRIGIDDVYQLDLRVERPGDRPESDTWDRV
jgi:hypothetical protein